MVSATFMGKRLSGRNASLISSYGTKAAEQTATLALTPGDPAAATGGHHNGTTASGGNLTPAEQAAFDKIMNDAASGPSAAAFAGWVVAGLSLLAAGWVLLRNRRRPAAESTTEDTAAESTTEDTGADSGADAGDEKEPVTAGAGTGKDDSKWAFKG